MKEPREFRSFDNMTDGWGNSILDEPRYSPKRIPEDDEEIEEQEIKYWASFDGEEITVVNKNDGSMECGNGG